MAKLKDCQFIEIKIDNKVVSGSSEEKKYKNWMEAYSPEGLSSYSGKDGAHFESVHASILVTKDSSNLYEKYLQRGYKKIMITIVHRGSDHFDKDYEIQRTVYNNCSINYIRFEMREKLFMNISFDFEGMVEVTFNVPNATDTSLDKIGPIKYDIPEKALK
ncbi:hypothetical protein ACMV5I_25625 [Serratia sp. T13T92]|jgi:hypothetical protein|uniref:hypothetical protein n=1 Tax=Serratia sp. T13T92 TaxID=3397496 RepID=UPI0039E03B87